MHTFTTYEALMTAGFIISTTVAIMQFGFRIQLKNLKEWVRDFVKATVTEHKLECIQDVEK